MSASPEQTPPVIELAERSQPLERLATLLLLQQKARAARNAAELSYLAVNDTALLVRTTVGLWFGRRSGGLRLQAVSGLPSPSPDAAFTAFADRLAAHLAAAGGGLRRVKVADLPQQLRKEWQDFLPPEAVWLALPGRFTPMVGGLLLARAAGWQSGEERLLAHWAEALGHAREHLGGRRALRGLSRFSGRKAMIALAAVLVLLAGALPINLHILAGAEVVPKNPVVVRSPISGVVETLLVAPNAEVKAGQPLVRYDLTELTGRLDVAQETLEIAAAELRQAQQQAIQNLTVQTAIPVLRARLEQRRAEIAYVESLFARANVVAQQDGVVVLPDASAWQGRPVKVGERIMLLADPRAAEMELWVPVADVLDLSEGAEVSLFLNNDPQQAVPARLRYASYQSAPGPDGVVAFRAVADFTAPDVPRLGLRGVAKVQGPRVSLAYALVRRPWSALRQWAGL